jgi:hypothetical protein
MSILTGKSRLKGDKKMSGWSDGRESPDPRFIIEEWYDPAGCGFHVQMLDEQGDLPDWDCAVEMPNGERIEEFQYYSDACEFVEKMAALLDKWGDTAPKWYRVKITYDGCLDHTVRAYTEEEAKQLAWNEIGGVANPKLESVGESESPYRRRVIALEQKRNEL